MASLAMIGLKRSTSREKFFCKARVMHCSSVSSGAVVFAAGPGTEEGTVSCALAKELAIRKVNRARERRRQKNMVVIVGAVFSTRETDKSLSIFRDGSQQSAVSSK